VIIKNHIDDKFGDSKGKAGNNRVADWEQGISTNYLKN
jgi:hypothetical protein